MINIKKFRELNDLEKKYIEKKFALENKADILNSIISLFFRKNKMNVLLKTDNEGLTGVLSFFVKGRIVEIDILYIEEKHRLNGFGKELINKLTESQPFKDIIVSLNKNRKDIESCINFLKANNFEFFEYKGSTQILFIKKPGN